MMWAKVKRCNVVCALRAIACATIIVASIFLFGIGSVCNLGPFIEGIIVILSVVAMILYLVALLIEILMGDI